MKQPVRCILLMVLIFGLTGTMFGQWSMPVEDIENSSAVEVPSPLGHVKFPGCEIRLTQIESSRPDVDGLVQLRFLAMVRTNTASPQARPIITSPEITRWSVTPEKQDMAANRWYLFYVSTASSQPITRIPTVRFRISSQPESETVTFRLPLIYDLPLTGWEACRRGQVPFPAGETLPENFFRPDDQWTPQPLPALWNDLGITWLRYRFTLPEFYRGLPVALVISAIDDKDQTYINGRMIGRTDGWDTLRRYTIPTGILRWNGENELIIGVHNNHAGGGIAARPIRLEFCPEPADEGKANYLAGDLFPTEPLAHESTRRPQGQLGNPLPLRPMTVRKGVLEYTDGGEVALWGTNYYPQSWQQYKTFRTRNIDPKQALVRDFDDFTGSAPARFDIIRIHVFDTEISDSQGNLVENDHLDIFDALVEQCNRRGVYLWLTPIAWWGSPNARPDAFSSQISMQAMTIEPSVRSIQENWYRQFLSHVNPYTGRRLVDEPCLVLFELINEPHYYQHASEILNWSSEPDTKSRYWKEKLCTSWLAQLPDSSWACDAAWKFYSYEQLLTYLDRMYSVIRSLGARQPIAFHASRWSTPPQIHQAIADSAAEAITLNFYSGLTQTPVGDKRSWLDSTVHMGIPAVLNDKARLVYEFDASDTLHQIDLYPALGRFWRELGVQVACQFQYDSQFTVDANQDWTTHYLNFRHTPERIASFLIGGQIFRSLPRGTHDFLVDQPDELVFPNGATSWKRNAAMFCTPDCYMQARETSWRPMTIPVHPKTIISTGSNDYFTYNGNGLVVWQETSAGDAVTLTIFPSVERLIFNTLWGTPEKPLTRLTETPALFQVKLPAWTGAEIQKKNDAGTWEDFPGTTDAFTPVPGVYRFVIRP